MTTSRRAPSLVVLAALAPLAGACAPPPSAEPAPPAARSASTAADEVVVLEGRVLEFAPSRDDLTVGTALLNLYGSPPEEVRVDGRALDGPWHPVELERVGENRFALPPLRIAFPRDGLLCLSVKVWFVEVGNQYDSFFYEEGSDRYALVSYATRASGPDWERARPRFAHNRVATLEAFLEALARPLPIALNQRPLADLDRLRAPR